MRILVIEDDERAVTYLHRGLSEAGYVVESALNGEDGLDLIRHHARRGGKQLALTAKEFSLLALMARRRGEVLTRTQIAELVWDIHFHSDSNVVDVAIGRLRRKIDHRFGTQLIHTVRGIGYVLEERTHASGS